MSLNDKILEIYEEQEHLSTEDVTRILKEKHQIDRSPRSIQRHIRELVKQGELTPDKPRGREQTYSVAQPPAYGKPKSLWDRLKLNFERVGGHLVEMQLQKASDGGFDPVTGWPQFTHDGTEYSIRGIILLRSAKELVGVAQSFKIYIERPHAGAGVLLTQDPIGFMDRLCWKGKLYQVKDIEERDDGYNFSFRIGYLEWLPK